MKLSLSFKPQSLPERYSDEHLAHVETTLKQSVTQAAMQGHPIRPGTLGVSEQFFGLGNSHLWYRSGEGICPLGALLLGQVVEGANVCNRAYIQSASMLSVCDDFINGFITSFDEDDLSKMNVMRERGGIHFEQGLAMGSVLSRYVTSGEYKLIEVDWPFRKMLPVPVGEAVYVSADV